MGSTTLEVVINTVKIAAIFIGIVSTVPLLVWVERRGSAFMQNRLGPNRVGPLGLLQLAADAVKFIFKEEFIPEKAEKVLYFMAPGLALLPAALTFAAVPMATPLTIGGYTFPLQITEIDVGIIFILAVGSLGVYGLLTAGWSSGNKYSLLGSLRAASQMISYEIALGLSIIGILMVYRTFNLNEMITAQQGTLPLSPLSFLPNWGVFYQPIAFILFVTAGFAETNRLPFDLPEGEAELVAGFHTEYGGFKFNMFFMAEYGHMITSAALITTLFFGGYALPYISPEEVLVFWQAKAAAIGPIQIPLVGWVLTVNDIASILTTLTHLLSFMAKTGFWLFFYIWIRWTLPRFRYDQLMDLGWKTLLPWGLANLFITAIVMYILKRGA